VYVDGKLGKALDFDGVNNEVTIADDIDLRIASGEDLTISFWVKTTDASLSIDMIVKRVGGNANFWLVRYGNGVTAGIIRMQIKEGAGDTAISDSSVTINDGLYHHIIASYKASTGRCSIFVDGIDRTTASTDKIDQVVPNTNPVSIGRGLISGGFFDGELDELRIYKRVLSQAEITNLFNNIKPSLRDFTMEEEEAVASGSSSGACTAFYIGTNPGGANDCDLIIGTQWAF
ncbi:MAG: LamG domain-containing protein, partial [Nitrososphaerales archaeon]